MTDYMLNGLVKKRAQVAGEISRTQDTLHKLVTDLEHMDATLRIVAPDMEIDAIRPKVFKHHRIGLSEVKWYSPSAIDRQIMVIK